MLQKNTKKQKHKLIVALKKSHKTNFTLKQKRKKQKGGTNPDICPCSKCKFVLENRDKDIWLHKTKYTEKLATKKVPGKEYNYFDGPKPEKYKGLLKPNEGKEIETFGTGVKPDNAIWFSHGSWLFDRYCQVDHSEFIKEDEGEEDEEGTLSEKSTANSHLNTKPVKWEDIEDKIFSVGYCDYYFVLPTDTEKFELADKEFLFVYYPREKPGKNHHIISIYVRDTNSNKNIPIIVNGKTKFTMRDIEQIIEKRDINENNIKNPNLDLDYRDKLIDEMKARREKPKKKKKKSIYNVFKIEHPKNILYINSWEEIDKFMGNYGIPGIKTFDGKTFDGFRWDKIYDEGKGYWGVAFNFRKLQHLPKTQKGTNIPYLPEYTESEYSWHRGYDVESLIIFDTRAFDDTVELVTIEL